MRRILFVGQTGALGGAEFVLLDIARHYRADCHVLLLADGPFRGVLEDAGVEVSVATTSRRMLSVTRDASSLDSLAAIPATLAAARKLAGKAKSFDIIYANSQKAAIVAMLAGWLGGKPVVWHLHDILSASHFGGLQRRVAVAVANRLARVVLTNSQASCESFLALGGAPSLVSVVLNGIDAAPFVAVSADEVAGLRRELGLSSCKVVGLFGRISPWKGQHVLIEALVNLPDVQALIVGDALFGETDYLDGLHARVRALGLEERVTWLGFRHNIAPLMRLVDVVVHASTAPEPFGRVILEAMLARRPVVASKGGASAEVLGAEYRLLAPPGDPHALARLIMDVLAFDPATERALIVANFKRATTLFSLQQMLAGIDRLLADIPQRAETCNAIAIDSVTM